MERATLIDLDGALCVRNVYCLGDKPENIIHYWPTGIRTSDFLFNYGYKREELPLPLRRCDTGLYAIVQEGYVCRPLSVRLEHGGQTVAVKVEHEPIPCPKVRAGIETRFYSGMWQKYLRSKGWVAA